ncbi:UNVERIFIED_CONTAM: hypothetical protein K2H54_037049 [Gekko kuhli]
MRNHGNPDLDPSAPLGVLPLQRRFPPVALERSRDAAGSGLYKFQAAPVVGSPDSLATAPQLERVGHRPQKVTRPSRAATQTSAPTHGS